jgi:hypothetical protein
MTCENISISLLIIIINYNYEFAASGPSSLKSPDNVGRFGYLFSKFGGLYRLLNSRCFASNDFLHVFNPKFSETGFASGDIICAWDPMSGVSRDLVCDASILVDGPGARG